MSKARAELDWWSGYYRENKNIFRNIREKDWNDRANYLPGIKEEKGIGLDYGSGLLSMLEFSGLKFDAIDPLMDEYRKIIELGDNYYNDTVNVKYDWIWCVNVLDHTAEPKKLIADINSKLKKGGRLYFEVNCDESLGGCHYDIYDKEKIDKQIPFKKVYDETIPNPRDKQSYYFAKYIK